MNRTETNWKKFAILFGGLIVTSYIALSFVTLSFDIIEIMRSMNAEGRVILLLIETVLTVLIYAVNTEEFIDENETP
mgnify:CR=1 FL=1